MNQLLKEIRNYDTVSKIITGLIRYDLYVIENSKSSL